LLVPIFVYSTTKGQSNESLVAKRFAESVEIESSSDFALKKPPAVPDSVVFAFKSLEKSNFIDYEKYLLLIYLKIYYSHLQCCSQSYDLRSQNGKSFILNCSLDPLLCEFVKLTTKYELDKPIEFLSSSLSYDYFRKHKYLRRYKLIKLIVKLIEDQKAFISR